jgi:hypothetical protein
VTNIIDTVSTLDRNGYINPDFHFKPQYFPLHNRSDLESIHVEAAQSTSAQPAIPIIPEHIVIKLHSPTLSSQPLVHFTNKQLLRSHFLSFI